uniref:Immunoglobulin V-set domain-containing protein n=1 Tax=Xiphophorus couchianus TaxID=32473 RepID=A0A3B5MGE2_9TELE
MEELRSWNPPHPLELFTYLLRFVLFTEKTHCKTLNQTAYRTAKTTIKCDYPHMYLSKTKFICKENNFTCKSILTTKSSKNSTGRFTLTHTSSDFNLSISPVSLNDAGVYWCGVIESNGSYQAGISKIQLEIHLFPFPPRCVFPFFLLWCEEASPVCASC